MTLHAWRGGEGGEPTYTDVPDFCKSDSLEDIRAHDFVLTPGRYVGLGDLDEDDEPFEEKMERLASKLELQFEEADKLKHTIQENLKRVYFPHEG